MSKPMQHSNAFRGIADEIISAMSALNMEPQLMREPKGIFLAERDEWAEHAMEHLREAMRLYREVEKGSA